MKKIIVFLCLYLCGCSSKYKYINLDKYTEVQNTISKISYANIKEGRKTYHTVGEKNVIALIVKEVFNDSIFVIINNEVRDKFVKYDAKKCDDCPTDEIIRFYNINYDTDIVKILSKNEKVFTTIDLDKNYNTYVISKYNTVWYVNQWPRNKDN